MALTFPSPLVDWPPNPADLFGACGLPTPTAPLVYVTDPNPNRCASTGVGTTEPYVGQVGIGVAIDNCGDKSVCCVLTHEAVHVHQQQLMWDYCAHDPGCHTAIQDYCRPVAEAEAYGATCNSRGSLCPDECFSYEANCAAVTAEMLIFCAPFMASPGVNPCPCHIPAPSSSPSPSPSSSPSCPSPSPSPSSY